MIRGVLLIAIGLHCGEAGGVAGVSPRSAQEYRLQAGQTLDLDLVDAGGSALLLEVDESGIDVDVKLRVGERMLRSFDGDTLRYGRHRIAAEVPVGATPHVQLLANHPGSPPGSVRVRFEPMLVKEPQGATRWALESLETEVIQSHYLALPAQASTVVGQAQLLLAERQSQGDDIGAGRAYQLLDRIFAAQSRRVEAIEILERAAPLFHRLRDRRAEAGALNNIAMHHWRSGDGRLAPPILARAKRLARAENDTLLLAVVSNNWCLTSGARGNPAAAITCFDRALQLSLASGDDPRIAVAFNNLGGAYSNAGLTRDASKAFEAAIRRREQSLGGAGLGDPLSNLGLELQAQSRFVEASELFLRAEQAFRAAGDQRGLGLALRNSGQLRLLQGDYSEAQRLFTAALVIQRALGRRDDLIATLARLGEAQRLTNGSKTVPPALEEALELADVDAEPRLLADAALRMARAKTDAGQPQAALALAERARLVAENVHNVDLRGWAALETGRALLAQGELDDAVKTSTRAITDLGAPSQTLRLADAYGVRGNAQFQARRYREAADSYAAGVAATDKAHAFVHDAERRARFLATQRLLHEGHVASLAELALAEGNPVLVRAAFEVNDGYRSRAMLEQLTAGIPMSNTATSPERSAAIVALREREAALATRRWRSAELGQSPEALADIEKELFDVSEQLALAIQALPQAAPPAPTNPSANYIIPLADDITVFHFLLTEQMGYAWVQAGPLVSLRRIAGEKVIRPLVQRVRERMQPANAPLGTGDALGALCDAVWQPVAELAPTLRVAIVADGSLHDTPWAALQCADDTGVRHALVESREVSLLPSLGVLQAHRANARRTRNPATTAMLAVVDPVYGTDDERLASHTVVDKVPISDASGTRYRGQTLLRLRATHDEATLLQDMAGTKDVEILEGFAATRPAVLAQLSRPYRLIHFGTHGVIGNDDLAGAGLLLSMLDAQGAASDGLLSAREIARTPLRADLIVLAACDSSRGIAVANEAPLGVTYGFLAAGARQVVATAWPVGDHAAKELISAFYTALLHDDMTAAAALRHAQLQALQNPKWRNPSNWAAFSIYGDWED